MARRSLGFSAGLLGLLWIVVVTGEAVQSSRVAVLEFRNPAGLSDAQRDYLVDAVVRGAVREGLPSDRFLVMTKETMITLLEEQAVNLEQVCEGECELDVGRKIGAHYIVTGSLWKVGASGIEVTVKLYDTKSASVSP